MRGSKKTLPGSVTRGRAVTDTCFETSNSVMKMWKDFIGNFKGQFKRMEKHNKTAQNKYSKRGVFKPAAQILLSVGGGNKSGLQCAGDTGNDGAAQLNNLTDFLSACETSVAEACNSTNFASLVNTTKLTECENLVNNFQNEAERCMVMTVGADKTITDEACACWTDASLYEKSQAVKKDCRIVKEAYNFNQALMTCKTKFSECRKYEDEAIKSISACKSNADDLKKMVGRVFIVNISPLSHLLGCHSQPECCEGEGSSSRGEDTGSQ